MRTVGLLAILCAGISFAQVPRVMNIHLDDGSIDTISCNRLDTAVGITFSNTHMRIGIVDGGMDSACTARIDSITFPYVGGPTYKVTRPDTPGQVFQVGDSITVQWNFNPLPAGQKAYFQLSTDGGQTWQFLTNLVCYMMYKDSTMQGTPCAQGVNYVDYPYVQTSSGLVGTWSFEVTDPLVMPDASVTSFSPVSDSVLIRIHDYENEEQSTTPMFSIKP